MFSAYGAPLRVSRSSAALRLFCAASLLGFFNAPGIARAQSSAVAEQSRTFNIPGQDLIGALLKFSEVSGIQLFFDSTLAEGRRSNALTGEMTIDRALEKLLQGTGLSYRRTNAGTITIEPAPKTAGEAMLLNRVVVEAGNSPGDVDAKMSVYEKPSSVSVVTKDQIERQPPRNTADVLTNVAGVFTSSPRTDPGIAVNIRGIQDFGRVNVMLDGVRQNFQKSGHGANGQVYLDPALLAGVDVTKGASSTAGGAGMIAGIVNFRTIDVNDLLDAEQTRGGRMSLSSGTNAYHFAGNAAYAQRFSDEFEGVAAISRKHIGGFRLGERDTQGLGIASFVDRDTGQDQWSGLVKGRWLASDEFAMGLSYIGFDADFGYTQSSNYTAYEVVSNTVKTDLQWAPAGHRWIDLDASLYYTVTSRDEWRSYAAAANADYNAFYETNTVGGTLENRLSRRWGEWNANWTAGTEFFFDWTDPHAAGSPEATRVGDFDPAWYAGSTPKGERLVSSVFNELRLDYHEWLQATAGLRYDWYQTDGSGQLYVGSVANPPGVRPSVTRIYTDFEVDRHQGFLAPRLQLAAKPWSFMQLYTSYGLGFRPPAITETFFSGGHVANMWANYPGVNLRPEESASFEVGMNLTGRDLWRDGDRAGLKLAWFDTRIDHYIVNAKVMGPTDLISGGLFADAGFVNLLNQTRFKGWELSADYEAGIVFGQLAYTRVDVDLGSRRYDPFPLGSTVGYPPTELGQGVEGGTTDLFYNGPPEQKLATSVGVRLFERRAELGYRFRFEEQNDLVGIVFTRQPYLRLHDLWATYRPIPHLTLRLAVDNLLDVTYIEMMGSGTGSYGPGRTVISTVSLNF